MMQILNEILEYFASAPLDPLFCVEDSAKNACDNVTWLLSF